MSLQILQLLHVQVDSRGNLFTFAPSPPWGQSLYMQFPLGYLLVRAGIDEESQALEVILRDSQTDELLYRQYTPLSSLDNLSIDQPLSKTCRRQQEYLMEGLRLGDPPDTLHEGLTTYSASSNTSTNYRWSLT